MKVTLDHFVTFFRRVTELDFLTALDRSLEKLNTEVGNLTEVNKNFISAATGAQTFQLPSGFLVKKDFFVVKTDGSGNAVTLLPAVGESIEGASSLALAAQYNQAYLTFNTGVWYRIDA